MFCGQQSFVHASGLCVHGKLLRCRSWQCENCRPQRHRQMVAEAAGGRPNRFITITLRADPTADVSAQGKRLSRAWLLICKRIARAPRGSKVEYFARLEVTKRGTPHLHVLARCGWIDQRELSLMAAELLDAPIVWIEAIDHARNVAGYIAKYLAKDDLKVGTCKRYWKTRGYDLRPKIAHDRPAVTFRHTDITNAPIERVARSYALLGYAIEWTGRDAFSGTVPGDLSNALADGEPVVFPTPHGSGGWIGHVPFASARPPPDIQP